MEKKLKNKTLWMRNVDFKMLMSFAYFIFTHSNQYRPSQLECEATKAGLFSRAGKNFGHTTKFNYRKILEHLGFISISNGKYIYNTKKEFRDFIIEFKAKNVFSEAAMAFIGKKIVENEDCRENFFDLFFENNDYSFNDIGRHGGYLLATPMFHEVVTQKGKSIGGVRLSSAFSTKGEILLDTADKIQAIFWGVRKWAYDFQITDEFFFSPAEGRIIYPISRRDLRTEFLTFLMDTISNDNSGYDWISIHIPTLIKNFILKTNERPSIESIKKMIDSFVGSNRRNVIYIPTSVSVIESKIPIISQVQEYKKCFIHHDNIGYISHIKINRKGLCHE